MEEKLKQEKYEQIIMKDCANLKHSTIYYFLKTSGFSENYIKNLRNTPDALILNSKTTTIRENIKDGDKLYILKNPNKKTKIEACDGQLEILYEDDDYLIVFKLHNLACTPTRSHYTNNLGGQICKYMQEKDENFVLRIVNRLDRETAGIVIVAKNVISRNAIKDVYKEYHAVCYGNLVEEHFTINKPILTKTENGINQLKREISPLGKSAITHVSLIKNMKNCALVSLVLETGRTHQIRVHMASINHPLIGDTIYYSEESQNFPDSPDHAMLLLKKITFTHFRTNKLISIELKKDLTLPDVK